MIVKYVTLNLIKWLCLVLLVSSCAVDPYLDFKPDVCYFPSARLIQSLPSSFPSLAEEEHQEEWGKELHIGSRFLQELDYYRAITSFKRALFIIPLEHPRRTQVEFYIFQAYYLAGKYAEALESFEASQLAQVTLQFTALDELLLMLYDSYIHTNQIDQAIRVLGLMEIRNCESLPNLQLSHSMQHANFQQLDLQAEKNADIACFLNQYKSLAKSPKKARLLNAFLPGAGYLYVDQPKTAFTALMINTLFTAAAYQFFNEGYWAAGLVTAGIEAGWYLGGINGAGIAANEYNERLYECQAKDFMIKNKLFPILMFRYAF
ncbi:Uncharacterized protein PHSC3_001138 [Chlamydiales bacterium STE3]|nr:Uncharacterized protein PHSC3_001138 [Chlamydiales bacterium STE3]